MVLIAESQFGRLQRLPHARCHTAATHTRMSNIQNIPRSVSDKWRAVVLYYCKQTLSLSHGLEVREKQKRKQERCGAAGRTEALTKIKEYLAGSTPSV